MDFGFSAEDQAFREEVTAFAQEALPADWGERAAGINPFEQSTEGEGSGDAAWELMRGFQSKLAERGWLALAWPKEHGGAGASFVRQALFTETMAELRAPVYNQGIDRVGPTIMQFGTPEQQARLLPPIRDGDLFFCQGFSEPGAGSDLASARTRAARDGDDYVINGQKIWTSYAHRAERMFLLARSDPHAPKHKGLSYFVLEMDTPGISVKPLVDLAGRHHFNEVFFEDVRVPAANRIGEENAGWYAAAASLDFERSGIYRVVGAIRTLHEITALAKQAGADSRRAVDDDRIRHRLAELHIEFAAGRLLAYRVASLLDAGEAAGNAASVSKLFGSELQQRLAGMLNLMGLPGQLGAGSAWAPLEGRLAYEYLIGVQLTIAAGTSEIQRNIIARRRLGLPRE